MGRIAFLMAQIYTVWDAHMWMVHMVNICGILYLYRMLRKLYISNYAIINEAEIDFAEGMNIITGETGAGKSILLGALGMVLGARADTKVLFDTQRKCVVEGHFAIDGYGLRDFFDAHGIDYESDTIIRRELTDNGKSRSFINDTPVNLQVLQKLADKLVTIHSQHETLDLGQSGFQLTVIDALANTSALLESFRKHYHAWQDCDRELQETIELAGKAGIERDFIQFQFEELDKAALDGIDQTALEAEFTQLTHAEEIKRNLLSAYDVLEGGQQNISDLVRSAVAQLRQIEKYAPELSAYIHRLESAYIDMRDVARDLEDLGMRTQADPTRSEAIHQQLSAVYRMQKKHGVQDITELIALRDSFAEKLHAFENSEQRIAELTIKRDKLFAQTTIAAKKLSDARKAVFVPFEKQVKQLLAEVGMQDAVLSVGHSFDTDAYLSATGADHIQFLFSANKGAALQDIKRVASGGELSRLMLCIKSLLANSIALPTLIFDEIDTGVSGEVAHKVGTVLMRLADNHQLIAITHLPQIAARGMHHLFVYKTTSGASTHTHIRLLPQAERITEIAKMLSGEKPTPAAIKNAKELLSA